jgi:hypothetical protein
MRGTVVQGANKLSGNWTARLSGEILKIDDDKKMRVGSSTEVWRQFVTLPFLPEVGISHTLSPEIHQPVRTVLILRS